MMVQRHVPPRNCKTLWKTGLSAASDAKGMVCHRLGMRQPSLIDVNPLGIWASASQATL